MGYNEDQAVKDEKGKDGYAPMSEEDILAYFGEATGADENGYGTTDVEEGEDKTDSYYNGL